MLSKYNRVSIPPNTNEGAGKQADALLDRLSLVISTTTSISTLLICLSSDSLSATLLLWVASGLCAACLFYVYVSKRPARGTKAARSFLVATAASVALLSCAWLFAYRDEIRFSWTATGFSKVPSVLVDEAVSRGLLVSKITGSPPRRLASFVNDLVQEPHRTRICSVAAHADEQAELVVTGELTNTKFLLRTIVPQARGYPEPAPNPKTLPDVLASVDSNELFLASAYDHGPVTISMEASPDVVGEILATAYHLGTAARQSMNNDPRSLQHMQRFLQLVPGLPSEETSRDWILDGILFVVSKYESTHDYFGYLLLGNGPNSNEAFDSLRQQSQSPAEVMTCEYWRARGAAET